MGYDSTYDTVKHMENVRMVFNDYILPELQKRSELHDKSKLSSPEKESYDKWIPILRKLKYGTKEYFKAKDEMYNDCTCHHFKNNPHHPEHYKTGIHEMDLFDFVEMFADHFAASLRSDTGFADGLKINKKRYEMDPMIYDILKNTYDRYFAKDEKRLHDFQV